MKEFNLIFVLVILSIFSSVHGWGYSKTVDIDFQGIQKEFNSAISKLTGDVSEQIDGVNSKLDKINDFMQKLYIGEALLESNDNKSNKNDLDRNTTEKPCICPTIEAPVSEAQIDQPIQLALSAYEPIPTKDTTKREISTKHEEEKTEADGEKIDKRRNVDENVDNSSKTDKTKFPSIDFDNLNQNMVDVENVIADEIKNVAAEIPKCINQKPVDDGKPNKGECVAQVIDSHDTIGMFYMSSYRHGHCSNRHPLPFKIRQCLGYCVSSSYIDRTDGRWIQSSKCKSCKAINFEKLRIPLICDDGFNFHKDFENIVECRCEHCENN